MKRKKIISFAIAILVILGTISATLLLTSFHNPSKSPVNAPESTTFINE